MRIFGGGEDIWVAVLRKEVRLCGGDEDIWVAVLGEEVRILGGAEVRPLYAQRLRAQIPCKR